MQTKTQHRMSRALGFLLAAIIVLPAHLVSSPAHASTTGAPGVIPTVRYDGNGPGSVSISWDAPRSSGSFPVSDYIVEYRGVGGAWVTHDDGLSTERSTTVTGLEPSRDYEFRVAAANQAGVGPASTLGIGENFQTGLSTCAENPTGRLVCFEGSAPRFAGTWMDDPNEILPAERVEDVIEYVGYSQTYATDLQCALSRSRGVLCVTRFNEQGQQGIGYAGQPTGNFPVNGLPADIVDVSVLGNTACALSSSGELWCWGRWSSDRFGPALMTPVKQFSGVKAVDGLCAIQWDDTMTCLATNLVTYQWKTNPAIPTVRSLSASESGTICAVTTARTVVCSSNFTGTFSTIANLSDVDEFTANQGHWCALLLDSSVTCGGGNASGQLGDGSFVSGRTIARVPEPVAHLADAEESGGAIKRTCAIGISATVYCWGNMIQAMGVSTLPRAVAGFGSWHAHAAVVPSQVQGLTQTGRTATTVSVGWSTPAAGDYAITGYVIEWRIAGGTWESIAVPSIATTWRSPAVPLQSTVEVKVAASSAAGIGVSSRSLLADTSNPPLRPATPTVTSTTGNSVSVSWRPASSPDEPVTGYRIEWTTDQTTWQTRTATATESTATISGLSAGSAVKIRLAALNAAGASSYSDTVTAFTTGLVSHTIAVEDATGQPVYGGQITWRKRDGSFESALDYGLTVDGRATFPYIPAGVIDVTLTDVQLLGGAVVDYNTSTVIGFVTDSLITLPKEPSESQHVVRVVLENGLPVVGADVVVDNLEGVAVVDGATFTTPEVDVEGTTNEFGEVYLSGYSTAESLVIVEYSDGILIQRATARLGRGDVEIVLEDMPWIDTPVISTENTEGSLVTLTVAANTVSSPTQSDRVVAGAKVSITPPKGATQSCKGKQLSSTVQSNGTATLKVCASKSGRYVLNGNGVIATGAVSLKVKGTAPLPIVNGRAVSPSHGNVTVTWNAPTYSGGNPVSRYTVTLKRGKKSISKVVSGTSANFGKLPGTSRWSVTVTATTKFGTSEPVRMVVPVS